MAAPCRRRESNVGHTLGLERRPKLLELASPLIATYRGFQQCFTIDCNVFDDAFAAVVRDGRIINRNISVSRVEQCHFAIGVPDTAQSGSDKHEVALT